MKQFPLIAPKVRRVRHALRAYSPDAPVRDDFEEIVEYVKALEDRITALVLLSPEKTA